MKSIAVMILAAGAATRMKKAKMLLPFKGTTILQQILHQAKGIQPENIVVVTGFYHDAILQQVHDPSINFYYNDQWQEGMSASIKKGLSFINENNPNTEAIIILVADQPFLQEDHLRKMLSEYRKQEFNLVATRYGSVIGTPVLFTKAYFSSLENLTGDTGARSILQQFPDDVKAIDFEEAAIDIDTEEDYKNYCLKE